MLNVIALGGNAILDTDPTDVGQKEVVQAAVKNIVDFIEQGEQVVICHGNGPQVGNLLLQQEANPSQKNPALGLDTLVAMTEGSIGYWIQNALFNELAKRGINKETVALVSQVVVSGDDPAFENPSKPIGPFFTEEEARERMQDGSVYKEDANRGYRKFVASPKPTSIVESKVISTLLDAGVIPIVAGGGGIPVVDSGTGAKEGIEAVVDKDFAAMIVAKEIGADKLILVTGVDQVYVNFGKPDQAPLGETSVSEARQYIGEDQFAPGSMLPKVEASISFVEGDPNRQAIITSLEQLSNVSKGAGTIIKD